MLLFRLRLQRSAAFPETGHQKIPQFQCRHKRQHQQTGKKSSALRIHDTALKKTLQRQTQICANQPEKHRLQPNGRHHKKQQHHQSQDQTDPGRDHQLPCPAAVVIQQKDLSDLIFRKSDLTAGFPHNGFHMAVPCFFRRNILQYRTQKCHADFCRIFLQIRTAGKFHLPVQRIQLFRQFIFCQHRVDPRTIADDRSKCLFITRQGIMLRNMTGQNKIQWQKVFQLDLGATLHTSAESVGINIPAVAAQKLEDLFTCESHIFTSQRICVRLPRFRRSGTHCNPYLYRSGWLLLQIRFSRTRPYPRPY